MCIILMDVTMQKKKKKVQLSCFFMQSSISHFFLLIFRVNWRFLEFSWDSPDLSRTNVVVSRSVLVNLSAVARCSPYSCCFVWSGESTVLFAGVSSERPAETAISGESVQLGNTTCLSDSRRQSIQMVRHLHCETLIKHSDGF